jgi:predicted permease
MRAGLALLQTALSVVLLFGAGVFVRSLNQVHHIDFGFQLNGLYNATLYTAVGSVKREERPLLAARVLEEMARVPGVQHVAAATSLPFYAWRTTHLRLQGVDSIRKPPSGGPYVTEITPGYLAAMGLDVLRGRGFDERDTETAPRVALVNRSMARYFWPGENPLGKCIYIGTKETRCSEVVGIVEDAAQKEVRPEMVLQYYLPLAQKQDFGVAGIFVARVDEKRGDPVRALGTQMLRADPRIRFAQVASMTSRIAPETRSWTLGATMFSVFGILALIVAAIGLYSVLAFDVAQRTRELGLRAALGASRPRLIRMVVNRSLRVTMAGITIGVIIALSLAGRLEQLLFQVPARDPVSIVGVSLLLVVVAFAAGLLPGLRAASVDPSTSLKA